jgi:hypothetical protein
VEFGHTRDTNSEFKIAVHQRKGVGTSEHVDDPSRMKWLQPNAGLAEFSLDRPMMMTVPNAIAGPYRLNKGEAWVQYWSG